MNIIDKIYKKNIVLIIKNINIKSSQPNPEVL